MSKRSGSSNSSGRNNKRRTKQRVPTDFGPWSDLRNIMGGVAEYARLASSNNLHYWSSYEEKSFLRLCIQDPSLVANVFFVGYGNLRSRVTPLTFLIKFRATLSLVQVFCKKFPHALEIKCEGLYPLEIACAKSDVTPGIIPFLAESYPKAVCRDLASTIDDLLDNFDHDQDNSNSSRNDHTLDNLKAVVDAANTAFTSGFLENEDFQLLFFDQVIGHGSCYKKRDLMKFVVEHCPLISEFEMKATQHPGLPWLHRATQNISSKVLFLMPQLEELTIDVDFDRENLRAWQNFMHALGNSSHLETFRLRILNWPVEEEQQDLFAVALNDALDSIPNLKRLFMCGCLDSGGGLGKTLTNLLRGNELETMVVLDSRAPVLTSLKDHEPILAALKDNTSIECFGVESCIDTDAKKKAIVGLLTDKNTSLKDVMTSEECSSPCCGDHNCVMEHISYLCVLNGLGRGIARDPFTPSAALVERLQGAIERAIKMGDSRDPDDPFPDSAVVAMMYGLLRECPSIWCG